MPKGKYTLADLAPDQGSPAPGAPAGKMGQYTAADLAPDQPAAAQPAQPGLLSRAWDAVNRPLVNVDTEAQDKFVNSPPSEFDIAHPYLGAAARGITGAGRDAAKMIEGMTSPVGIATMAAGGLAKAPGIIGKFGRAASGLAGAGFFAKGASDVATNAPAAIQGDPEAVQRTLQGGAMALGGAAGGASVAKAGPGMAARATRAISAPMADVMNTPRGMTPAESMTPADIKTYAQENAIPLRAAEITDHNFPRNLKMSGERASFGGTQVRQGTEAAKSATATHIGDLMDQMSPGVGDTAQAGEAIRTAIGTALEREKEVARSNFSRVDELGHGVLVNLQPVKELAGELLQRGDFVRQNAPSLDLKHLTGVLRDVQDLPENANFTNTQLARSRLLDETRRPELAISTEAQGALKRLTGAIHQQMLEASQSSPGLSDAFTNANAHWEGLQEAFNSPRSPLFQALQEADPAKIPQKFIQRGSTGGSAWGVEQMDKYNIDKAPLKREVLDAVRNGSFSLPQKALGKEALSGYSDQYLRSVFTPEELQKIYTTGAIARSAGMVFNPSGTSDVMSAIGDVTKPKAGLFKSIAAATTNSKVVNGYMTKAGPGMFARPIVGIASRAAAAIPSGNPAGTVAAAAANSVPEGYHRVKSFVRKNPSGK